MFNKKDPLIDSVKRVMEENQVRREVEQALNEELGIQTKKQLPFENHAEYDAILAEAIQEALSPKQQKLAAIGKKVNPNDNPNTIGTSDLKAARMGHAKHIEEEQLDEAGTDTIRSYLAKNKKQRQTTNMPIRKASKRADSYDLAMDKLTGQGKAKILTKEEEQLDEAKVPDSHKKAMIKSYGPGRVSVDTKNGMIRHKDKNGEINSHTYDPNKKQPIGRHVGTISVNEEEQLDEVLDTDEKKMKYAKKAADQIKAYSERGGAYDMSAKGEKDAKGVEKRTRGLQSLVKKLQGMKEESQLDEASYSAKAARAGKDIGKKGKMFSVIAKKAASKYGSEERGKKVAGAVLKKLRNMKEESEDSDPAHALQEKAPPGAKFERMVKHIKAGYAKDGKLTDVEKRKAYGAAWKAKNKSEMKEGILDNVTDTIKSMFSQPGWSARKEADRSASDNAAAQRQVPVGAGPGSTAPKPATTSKSNFSSFTQNRTDWDFPDVSKNIGLGIRATNAPANRADTGIPIGSKYDVNIKADKPKMMSQPNIRPTSAPTPTGSAGDRLPGSATSSAGANRNAPAPTAARLASDPTKPEKPATPTAARLASDPTKPEKPDTATPAPTTATKPSSFGQAFAAARKAAGGAGGKFTYRGKEYQTNIAGEKYKPASQLKPVKE